MRMHKRARQGVRLITSKRRMRREDHSFKDSLMLIATVARNLFRDTSLFTVNCTKYMHPSSERKIDENSKFHPRDH